MAEDLAGSARITIELDDAGAVADARILAQRISAALDRGTTGIGTRIRRNIEGGLRRAIPVNLDADPQSVVRGIRAALAFAKFQINVEVDTAALVRSIRTALAFAKFEAAVTVVPDLTGFMPRLRAALAGEEVRVRVVPDPQVVRVRADVDTRDADRNLSRLAGALGGVAGAAGRAVGITVAAGAITALGAGAAAAAGQVIAFSAALAPAVGIIAAVPASLAGATAAFGALALALNGVGEAFGAALTGDAEEFAEAIEGLSPAAQAAAREVRALRPAFDALRESVQDAFFEQFEGQITRVASAIGGPLRRGLVGISENFGLAASNVADFLRSADGVRSLEQILAGAEEATGGFATALTPVIAGFTRLSGVISEAFGARLGQALASAGESFGAFLTDASESGRAVDWVENALAVFRQLGTLLGNIGSILGSVFNAAEAASGGLLATLGEVTGQLASFFNTAEGTSALQSLFMGLADIGSALSPVLRELVLALGTLGPVIGEIAQAVGPVLAQAIGMVAPLLAQLSPAITAIFGQLGPFLDAIGPGLEAVVGGLAQGLAALAPALEPVGRALGAIGLALAPLLPAAGQLIQILARLAAEAVLPLAEALTPVIAALVGSLMPVVQSLVPIFQQFLAAAAPLVTALGEGLAQALAQLLPPLLELVPQLLAGLLPAFQQLVAAVTPLIPLFLQLITQAIVPLIPLLGPVIAMVAQVAAQLANWLVTLQPIISAVLRLAIAVQGWTTMNVVVPILSLIIGGLQRLMGVVNAVITTVQRMVTTVIGWFRTLYNTLVGNSIVPDLINGIVRWFTQLPGRIVGALGSMVSMVVGVFTRVASGARSAVVSMINGIVSLFSGLGGRIISAMGDIAGRIRSRITSGLPGAIRNLIPGFADGGIIRHEMLARVGEGGKPEVIIPLTKPQRARQLAEESGLFDIIGGPRAPAAPTGGGITNHFTITEVGNAETTAARVVRRMTLAGAI